MKQAIVRLLSAALTCGFLTTGAGAATLQSGQASYQLTLDPLGTEPFSYSDTEVYSATLVPVGTRVESDSGALLLVEVFTYSQDSGHWVLDSLLSGQSELVVRDDACLYHVSTLPGDGQGDAPLDRGIWLKAPGQDSCQPVSATGELVDEWALNLVNQAIADGLMPSVLQGRDLRSPITRAQFAALTVRLYEAASGQAIPAPEEGSSPFTDTDDPEILKAYRNKYPTDAFVIYPDKKGYIAINACDWLDDENLYVYLSQEEELAAFTDFFVNQFAKK